MGYTSNDRLLWDIEQAAIQELREYIVDEGNSRHNDVQDRLHEIADSSTPVYNFDLLQCAEQNLNLGFFDDGEGEGATDIYSILMRTICRHLEEVLGERVDELLEELEEKEAKEAEAAYDEDDGKGQHVQMFPVGMLIEGVSLFQNSERLRGDVVEYDPEDDTYRITARLRRMFGETWKVGAHEAAWVGAAQSIYSLFSGFAEALGRCSDCGGTGMCFGAKCLRCDGVGGAGK